MPAGLTDRQTSVAARELGAGQFIGRNELRRELAVKNGDIVKVVAGSAEWQITIDGVAQGSGYLGDTVNVKIPRTAKLVSGTLKERGLVEVRE
jgi:flagella basal body P-ring formation protein FlgA